MSNLTTDKEGRPAFPHGYAGITELKCGACDFEFVFIEPEETMQAIITMHAHVYHDHHNSPEITSQLLRY